MRKTNVNVLCALLVLLLAGALATGCERSEDAERERAIKIEQDAIDAYSAKIPDAERYQKGFVAEWQKANEIKDLKAFKEGIEARVIPALGKYVAALEVMPMTGSKTLTDIHGGLARAYAGAVGGFTTFVEGLTDENVEARYADLLKSMEAVMRAEKGYRKQLGDYYAANRVKLVDGAPAAAAPAAGK